MISFKSQKARWWAIGVFAVILGLFVAATVLPNAGEPYGSDAPDIRVPNMQNHENVPNLQLNVSDDKETDEK